MPLPIDLDKDVAVGISLPVELGPNGYFRQTYTTLEQVTSNVINLILTIPGERYMQPTFGSRLHEHLFEQFDESIQEFIEDSINESMEEWLPYVNIVDLKVTDGGDDLDPQSGHTIRVSLTIALSDDPDTHMNITFRGEAQSGGVTVESISPITDNYNPLSNRTSKEVYNSVKR
tara:strand:+ start:881 stop:1402 length:522 start_codon:yes stop_codon:yes gene_type:complete